MASNLGGVPLHGGRTTPGVVLVEDTVRRPVGPNSRFVHELLEHLEAVGFLDAPRFLGMDDQDREVLSYIDGKVPRNLDATLTDAQLVAAARLLRRYHAATAGSTLAGDQEVVCHNDISPVNTVFVGGKPTALIDFDSAGPGARISDVAYGMFLWLNLGWDGPDPDNQRRRIAVWCDAYGLADGPELIGEVMQRVGETAVRLRNDRMEDAARWWEHQLDWLQAHHRAIAS